MNLFTNLFADDDPALPAAPVDLATEGNLGIVRLTPVVDALLAVAVAVEHSAADGVTWSDSIDMVKPVIQAAKAFRHYEAAKNEALDVTPYEAAVLADRIAKALGGLHNAKAARVATIIANMSPDFLELLSAIKDLRTEPAPPAPAPASEPPRAEIMP